MSSSRLTFVVFYAMMGTSMGFVPIHIPSSIRKSALGSSGLRSQVRFTMGLEPNQAGRMSRRDLIGRVALLAPICTSVFSREALASGASPEEAAKYAKKYQEKVTCSPRTPQYCSGQYAASLGSTDGVSQGVIDRKNKRDEQDQSFLKQLLPEPGSNENPKTPAPRSKK
uniref:Uncharacterized protein n=1 Tax=Octactis speculum TaxID=3111310 RepID=A0A7S2DGJ5_9STRA